MQMKCSLGKRVYGAAIRALLAHPPSAGHRTPRGQRPVFPGEDCREEDLEEQINGEIETTMNLELENKKALVTG